MDDNGHEGLVVLDRNDVTRLLPMRECVDVMAAALATVARGNAILPLRPMIRLPDSPNIFALMPAYLGEPKAVGVKVLTVFPVNHGTPIDAHQGAVLLFEAEHGRLLAILDATTVTAIRTAAVSAVATRLLARDDAEDLAILGAGTQGTMHLEAMTIVRPIRRVHVWSRTTEHARSLVQLARERFDLQAEVASTPAHAVERASIVCTTTASPTPVLEGAWLRPGTHINAVGACIPTTRELDTDTVRRARLYVDRRESALAEPGDILMPLEEGAISTDHIIAEVGELLLERGAGLGRQSDDDVTLFKSLGLAVEDLAAAHHVYRKAAADGSGNWIVLGGMHEETHAELHA
ncbi:MAG TPA: ornithine cyclodeaminase family protein [Gemmatimonadaceae bacterium]|jgi:ornithine cyclodeaminase